MSSEVPELDERAAAIAELLRTTHFGEMLRARGESTVAIDEDGHLRRYEPDGTSHVLPQPDAG